MASASEMGQALLGCLNEVSGLLDAAGAAAEDEQKALVKSDVDAVLRSCRAQEEALRRIGEVDQRAAELATHIAELSGLDSERIDAQAIAEAAGAPYDRLLPTAMQNVARKAEQIKTTHEINRKLIDNGIEIVGSCLRSLACETSPPAYSANAAFTESRPHIISLDSRA